MGLTDQIERDPLKTKWLLFTQTVKGKKIFTRKVQKIHFLQNVNDSYLILQKLQHTPVSQLFLLSFWPYFLASVTLETF